MRYTNRLLLVLLLLLLWYYDAILYRG